MIRAGHPGWYTNFLSVITHMAVPAGKENLAGTPPEREPSYAFAGERNLEPPVEILTSFSPVQR